MKNMFCSMIGLALAVTLLGCESPGSNGKKKNGYVKDPVAQKIYSQIMRNFPKYETLAANRKALAVCINWSGTYEFYTDIRYSYAYYESPFSERAIYTSELIAGAVNRCEKVRKRRNLDCQCVLVDRNGSSGLKIPESVRIRFEKSN